MSIKLKVNALEDFINKEVDKLECGGYYCSSKMAIYSEDGIEVQIVVTRDEDELMDEVWPTYEAAES